MMSREPTEAALLDHTERVFPLKYRVKCHAKLQGIDCNMEKHVTGGHY